MRLQEIRARLVELTADIDRHLAIPRPEDGPPVYDDAEMERVRATFRAGSATDERRNMWARYLRGERPFSLPWLGVDHALAEALYMRGVSDPFAHPADPRVRGQYIPGKGVDLVTFMRDVIDEGKVTAIVHVPDRHVKQPGHRQKGKR